MAETRSLNVGTRIPYGKCNKDAIEKARIANRRGGHIKQEVMDDVVKPAAGTALFEPDNTRFSRNPAALEHELKLEKLLKYEDTRTLRREGKMAREHQRWKAMEKESACCSGGVRFLRTDKGLMSKNKSREEFNIISLEYSKDGQGLRQQDQTCMEKACKRAQFLQQRSNSVPHDIITGLPRQEPKISFPTT